MNNINNSFICFNGEIIKSASFSIPYRNRAFLFGDGLFETIKANGSTPLWFNLHYSRLVSSMELLKMNIPKSFSINDLQQKIAHLINANRFFNGARIRITVYRHGEGLYTPDNNDVNYLIESFSEKSNLYVLNSAGLKIGVFNKIKKPVFSLSNIKSNNALIYVLAGIYKTENNLDDSLILNQNNNICEAISSNVFLVKANCLYTPSINDGCVDGIMRKKIIELANKFNLKVIDNLAINENDLLLADEVFLTNAISGVKWILAYENKRYYNRTSKFLINKLNEEINP